MNYNVAFVGDNKWNLIIVVGRQRLRSATQRMMVVPRHRLSTVVRRAFTVQGTMVWNSLPDDLHKQQDC